MSTGSVSDISPSTESPAREEPAEDVSLRERIDADELPDHVAIIMDGNGRWARERGEQRVVGHHEGVESVRAITEECAELGIDHLTLYTFSTENWERPPEEVDALMQLLVHTVREEVETLMENEIRLNVVGAMHHLPDRCREEMEQAMELTAENDRMTLHLALSYSGRWELTRACRAIAERAARGEVDPEEIDEAMVERHLCTTGVPDPDLLIRTSGELRLSNFLLWQLAYTELYIASCYWPEFRRERLYEAIRAYQGRDRRYGRVSTEEASGSS